MTGVNPLRTLVVCRHYWPLLNSDTASRTVRLADALARSGMHVEVLACRAAAGLPDRMVHREIPVHRPIGLPKGDWSLSRYLRQLESWLKLNADRFDVLYSATMREEAIIVSEVAQRLKRGSVLHHSGTALSADSVISWPARQRRRWLQAIDQSSAVVVGRPSAQQSLISTGVRSSLLHRIECGVTASSGLKGREPAMRQRARAALAAVNRDLLTQNDSMVVLSCSTMTENSGVRTLAHAIPKLVNIWPDLRFWIIGDGPLREELHRYFKGHSVRQSVSMPGTFVDLSDLMMASDIYLQPSANEGLDDFVPQAIAAPLPLILPIATDAHYDIAEYDDCVGWFNEKDSDSLYRALHQILTQLMPAMQVAERLRRGLLQRRPYTDTIQKFATLMDNLKW